MFDPIDKIESEITGEVLRFDYSFSENLSDKIIINCFASCLESPIEQRFNHSSKWQKLNLKIGDKIKFLAKIKTTTFTVHVTERWHDDWGRLPAYLTDIEEQIDIQNPKQIIKI